MSSGHEPIGSTGLGAHPSSPLSATSAAAAPPANYSPYQAQPASVSSSNVSTTATAGSSASGSTTGGNNADADTNTNANASVASTSPAATTSSLHSSRPNSMPGSPRSRRKSICGGDHPERPYPIYLRGKVQRGFGRGGKELGCPTANLPDRVLQNRDPALRTGVYFGWARVLPQEEADESGSSLSGSAGRLVGASLRRAISARGTGARQRACATDATDSKDGKKGDNHDKVDDDDDDDDADDEVLSDAPTKRSRLAEDDYRVWPMVMSVGWNPFYKNKTKTAEVHIMHRFSGDFYDMEVRVVVLGYIRPEFNYVSREALIADIETDKAVALRSLDRGAYKAYAWDPFLGRQ